MLTEGKYFLGLVPVPSTTDMRFTSAQNLKLA